MICAARPRMSHAQDSATGIEPKRDTSSQTATKNHFAPASRDSGGALWNWQVRAGKEPAAVALRVMCASLTISRAATRVIRNESDPQRTNAPIIARAIAPTPNPDARDPHCRRPTDSGPPNRRAGPIKKSPTDRAQSQLSALQRVM